MTDGLAVASETTIDADLFVEVARDAIEPGAPDADDGARRGIGIAKIARDGFTCFVVLCVVLAVFLFGGTALVHNRDQVTLERRFRAAAATLTLPPQFALDASGQPTTRLQPIPLGSPVALLDIPTLGVHQVVSEGTTSGITRSGPGHLRATPLPGQYGNAVILGRRTSFGAPFRHLDELAVGDEISLTTGFGLVRYRVTAAGTASDRDASVFGTLVDATKHTRNTLSLITSNPALLASERYVVQAELEGTARGFSPSPYTVGSEELGLAGEKGAWLVLVLWLQVLLVASLLSVWLFRRWTRWCAWIVSAPVLLASMWLVFEQFTRVLPATL